MDIELQKLAIKSAWGKFMNEDEVIQDDKYGRSIILNDIRNIVDHVRFTHPTRSDIQYLHDFLSLFSQSKNHKKDFEQAIQMTNSTEGLAVLQAVMMELQYIKRDENSVKIDIPQNRLLTLSLEYFWYKVISLIQKSSNSDKLVDKIQSILNSLSKDNKFATLANECYNLKDRPYRFVGSLSILDEDGKKSMIDLAKHLLEGGDETSSKSESSANTTTPKKKATTSATKPKRRSLTDSQKKRVAARQEFKCANRLGNVTGLDGYECPFKGRDGLFDESGYDIDHIKELATGGADAIENCQALCLCCHRVKTTRFQSAKSS